MNAPAVGLQLYTVRAASLPLDQLLREVAGAGYDGVETVGTQGVEAEQLRDALQQNHLAIASAHVPLQALRRDLDALVRSHQALGTPLLVVPYLDERERPGDAAGWRAFGRELGAIGARLRDEGLALAYHHHDFELVGRAGEEPLRQILDAAAANDLTLELDTGWLLREGRSPVDWLDAFGPRVTRLHVKDLHSGAAPRWLDVGDGELDLGALVEAACEHGVPWLLVEHDDPSDPLVTMRRSASALLAALGR